MADLKAITRELYHAFQEGDIDAIIAKLAPDVKWDHWTDNTAQKAGAPWLQARTGPAQVREFFRILADFQYHEFRLVSLMVGDNKVAAEVVLELTMPTGHRVRDEHVHLFTFNDAGQIVAARQYLDTAKSIEAMRK